MLTGVAHDPDDKRPLFARVVDDIRQQIMTGHLQAEEQVPPAREIAETYGIATMTAQRALRELQAQGLTYGVPGKGSFVHPEAMNRLVPAETPVQSEEEYQAAVTQWQTGLDTSLAELDAAIDAEDWDRLKTARQAIKQALHDHHGLLIGATLYRHRQTGVDIDDQLAQIKADDDRAASTRRAERDQPKPTPEPPEPPAG
jgi:DNA-binding transcriptional regulator YhcF (GntR family)